METTDLLAKIREQHSLTLNKILNQHELTDVTFIIGPNQSQFAINRLLLAIISPVFQAMLYGNMKESEPNSDVIIDDIDAKSFECIIKFAHSQDPEISMKNITSLKSICDRYQILFLSKLCDEYFETYLTAKHLCFLWNEAIKFKVNEFVLKCEQFIHGPAFTVDILINSKEYLSMNQLKFVLQSNNLEIKEEEIWEYALKCADFQSTQCIHAPIKEDIEKADNDNDDMKILEMLPDINVSGLNTVPDEYRLHLLKEICPFIRFGLMNAQYFVKNVEPKNCLTQNETIDILNYFICKDVKCGLFSTKRRVSKIQAFTVERGDVDAKDWQYGGFRNDAICIQTDKKIFLRGIGVLNCDEGSITVKCFIYKGENRKNNKKNIVGWSSKETIECKNKSKVAMELLFTKPISIEKNVKYTLEILQKNSNGASCRVINGKKEIKQNGVKIIFSDAVCSNNGTDGTGGAIPTLLCAVCKDS